MAKTVTTDQHDTKMPHSHNRNQETRQSESDAASQIKAVGSAVRDFAYSNQHSEHVGVFVRRIAESCVLGKEHMTTAVRGEGFTAAVQENHKADEDEESRRALAWLPAEDRTPCAS
jgi:hypothetical protein